MSSSMRNAVHRRNHKERAQPHERRKLGLLEKHKDYSERALRNKAAERNEDEFYFGMMSRKGPGSRLHGKNWSGLVKKDQSHKKLAVDKVRLLKTQDIKYIRTMRQLAAKQVKQLQEQVVLTKGFDNIDKEDQQVDDSEDEDEFNPDSDDEDDGFASRANASRKIVFADNENEREDVLEKHEQQEEEVEDDEDLDEQRNERAKSLKRLRKDLAHAEMKLKTLTEAERELEIQQAKMAKTQTSGGTDRRGNKLKYRKRKR
ncbi:hypothetical protein NLU13_1219 [Sarocladium strictum]|uniref:U3 small nucleolar RNA-associated protein 11 n=1 Tax=Sarocladium strictum TaxID=5046 RepID=A0AA39GQJ1_SARSR|nr:hypothetical protein NLU13_1219 [Sarocladium strictum]